MDLLWCQAVASGGHPRPCEWNRLHHLGILFLRQRDDAVRLPIYSHSAEFEAVEARIVHVPACLQLSNHVFHEFWSAGQDSIVDMDLKLSDEVPALVLEFESARVMTRRNPTLFADPLAESGKPRTWGITYAVR